MPRAAVRFRIPASVVAFLLLGAARVPAQVAPNADWRTIQTRHFYIHFTPQIEEEARRLAVDAERAYAELSSELHPPRGMVDVVLSDDVDFSNGSATPFPTSRIVLYANPPIAESALRYTDDWTAMVITHELTHIFHLDRTRGIWSVGQHVFGRAAELFPNLYLPSWLDEGLAVYYESYFTGAGRIAGSEHRMIARASAIDHDLPQLNQVSLASPRFPFGESAYAYGSLFVDYLARTRGERSIHDFIERSSAQLIPIWLNHSAKIGFGITFSQAFGSFRDSIQRSVDGPAAPPLAAWRSLTTEGVDVYFPRWLGDSTLVYTGTPGRESFSAYQIDLRGRRMSIGRRNGRTPNVRLPNGDLLFSQLEFTDPYHERNDLFVQRPDGRQIQLTHGARVGAPDARASDGAIVAVQTIPGATRLVRVSSDGKTVTAITTGSLDEQYTEPRWSTHGDRIAAARWRRGGISDIVILDTTGALLTSFAAAHSTQATPSWASDDRVVAFSSDRSGITEVYVHRFSDGTDLHGSEYRVSDAVTGLFEPQLSPHDTTGRLAAVQFRGDGYHLGVGSEQPSYRMPSDSFGPSTGHRPTPAIALDSVKSTKYSPWRTLWPRYWIPTLEAGMHPNEPRIGATTTGVDVIDRHLYAASLAIPVDNSGVVGYLDYLYAGLGLPIVETFLSQDWDRFGAIFSRTQPSVTLGEVRRRTRDAELATTWLRQRVRTAVSVTTGVGVERREYASDPAAYLTQINVNGRLNPADFPSVFVGAGFGNTQRPPYSVSPEDGISTGITVRDRLRSGFNAARGQAASAVGFVTLYKSLDLSGFAHHVIVVRGAGGWEDPNSSSDLEVGGNSGNAIQLIPGYTVGEGRRTFPVRGFAPASLFGDHAYAGSVEYRAPIVLGGRGLGLLPLFFERSSVTLFGDAASAWCGSSNPDTQACFSPLETTRTTIASAGAELSLNAALLAWDAPERYRVGIAVPVRGRRETDASRFTIYFAAGFPF